MIAIALEGEQALHSVIDAAHLHVDAGWVLIPLTVVDIDEYISWHVWLELKPLVCVNGSVDGGVATFFFVGGIPQRIAYMMALINTVSNKVVIEKAESLKLALLQREDTFLCQVPLTRDAVAFELVVMQLTAVEIDLLYVSLRERCILCQIHILS